MSKLMKEWIKDQKSESRGHSHLWPSLITLLKDAARDTHTVTIMGMSGGSHRKLDPHIHQVKTVIFIHDHQLPNNVNKMQYK